MNLYRKAKVFGFALEIGKSSISAHCGLVWIALAPDAAVAEDATATRPADKQTDRVDDNTGEKPYERQYLFAARDDRKHMPTIGRIN